MVRLDEKLARIQILNRFPATTRDSDGLWPYEI